MSSFQVGKPNSRHLKHSHAKTQRLAAATTIPALLEQRETLGTSFPLTNARAGLRELGFRILSGKRQGML